MTHKQITITEKETIHTAMHVMRCPECGRIVASASERRLLPQFATCEGEEEKTARDAASHFVDLYADEIDAKGEDLAVGSIHEWWGMTKEQYPDAVTFEDVEREIYSILQIH
ncbi:MAG: hypothetical protein ACREHG_08175 [Candidatus Saccharimonadales bacterium]